jgi:uncharacterized protein
MLLTMSGALRPALAQDIQFPERPDVAEGMWIVDRAALIGEAESTEINGIAGALMSEEQVPLLVVTLNSLAEMNAASYTIERYASELFDHWGIGSERRNYGMLLLVSKGDRKARIELGQAWAGQHDSEAREVMDTLIIPVFKRGDFSGGILAGVRGMDAMARGLQLPTPKAPWWILPLMGAGLILVICVIVSLFKSGRKGWGWALIAALGVLLFLLMRASASGGGGAFGGGSSGGGGASGSW